MILQTVTDKTRSSEKKAKGAPGKDSISALPKDNSFLSVLESIVPTTNENTAELNYLWRELPDKEKNFLNSPNTTSLEEYKSIVRKIIQLIIQKNTKLVLARRRGEADQKILHTIKIIDENIQLLATNMVNKNNSAFAMLKEIEKIRGLLFDLIK